MSPFLLLIKMAKFFAQ